MIEKEPMRHIIFDTETTGLDNTLDRIIEIGGVELDNHFPTGRSFHVYINPADRKVHPEALAVHGINDAFLADKPPFAEIVEELAAFFDGAFLVAHNATFDITFINAEFARLGHAAIGPERVVDTLLIARRKHPMGPNSLDALCRRYGIDNTRRTKHGALLDSELLSEVYIELIGGKQAALGLEVAERIAVEETRTETATSVAARRPTPLPSRLSEVELVAHRALVEGLGETAIWARIAPE
jgi:DNA polymerase-3 subunit epsilon